jgi:hypothetical protein
LRRYIFASKNERAFLPHFLFVACLFSSQITQEQKNV